MKATWETEVKGMKVQRKKKKLITSEKVSAPALDLEPDNPAGRVLHLCVAAL